MATSKVDDSKMALILVNQIRASLDSYSGGLDAPGGNALKHNKSLDLRITKLKCKKSGFEDSHFMMKIAIMKSKFIEAKERDFCECYFRIGEGIDNKLDIILDAIEKEIVVYKQPGWYSYKDIKKQGYDNFAPLITEEHLEEIKNLL